MTKKAVFALALIAVLLLGGCSNPDEDYISGKSFDPDDYRPENAYEEYQNKLYGIIIDYPSDAVRQGNFELDGSIAFVSEKSEVEVFKPDSENSETMLTAEEYAKKVLDAKDESDTASVKYGKSSGFRIIKKTDDGKTEVDFVIKGTDAFYRFRYISSEENFDENNPEFQYIMRSIRIDDGEYNKLYRMANRYALELEYATSMQYITDSNYAIHCLSSYETTKDERNKAEAVSAYDNIKKEMTEIINYKREENEGFDEEWQKVTGKAHDIYAACEKIQGCIKDGRDEEARRLSRSEFGYDLSDSASRFIEVINAELSEY